MLMPSWQMRFLYVVQSINALNYLEKSQKSDLMAKLFKIKRLPSQLNSVEVDKSLNC